MNRSSGVLLVATMDTKGQEALYLEACLKEAGVRALIMDAGIRGESPVPVAVARREVAKAGGMTLDEVRSIGHEGEALDVMIRGAVGLAQDLYKERKINGVIGLGGSMGTTLGAAVMRSFPVGFPKVMISTMASRNTHAFIGTKDIMMLHSVCDISGLNRITSRVLRNGAMAVAGMLRGAPAALPPSKPLVFISSLGTTEVCVQTLRKHLEDEGNEVVIFHTVGAGGRAMEEMLEEEEVTAVVDLSLHEMADHRFGGDYDAGPERGAGALRKGVPTLLVPGNIDFLVTGPLSSACDRFPNRPLHKHNAAITAVRTDRRELESLAEVIAGLCNEARGPWKMLVPLKGLSAFDSNAGPLHDPEGARCFSEAVKKKLRQPSFLQELPYHINDPEFARALIEAVETLKTSFGRRPR